MLSAMLRTKDAYHCPRCGHDFIVRLKRRWWMRLVGIDRHLRCGNCRRTLWYRESQGANSNAGDPANRE